MMNKTLPIVWPASYWWWIWIGWRFNPRSPVVVLLSGINVVLLTCCFLVLLPTVLLTYTLFTISNKTKKICFLLTKPKSKDVHASKIVNIFVDEDLYVLYIFHDKGVMSVFSLNIYKRLNYINVVIQLFSRHIFWQRRHTCFDKMFLCMWYRVHYKHTTKWILSKSNVSIFLDFLSADL